MESEYSSSPIMMSMMAVSVRMVSMVTAPIDIMMGECFKANGDLVRKMEKGSIKEQMGYFKLESGSMINFKFDTFYHF